MEGQTLIKHYEDLFIEYPKDSSFLYLQKKLTKLLDSLKFEDKNIILAISWWADSMVVASQILYYYWQNGLDFSNIHIAHCNHKIRKESETEAKFMSEFFSGLDFHLYERDTTSPENENSLRNRRYANFSSLQESTKASFMFLGHHLNDRVESTFLNLMRWAWINGFLNMREVENHHLLPDDCKVCRPLINSTKSEILDICSDTWIPFFEDITNKDVSVSRRNRVRNQILNPVSIYWTENWEENKFLESFAWIYTQLESFERRWGSSFTTLPTFPLWNAKFSYLWNNDILNCDENDVFDLFHSLKIQTSATVVDERKDWLNKWENGYKYIWWVYFFIHEKQLFTVNASKEFWKRKNNSEENIVVWIDSMDDVNFLGLNLNIPRDELIWWDVRLPQDWDIFAWKKWNRWALNQKIPMWWREWIPLAIKNGKVIHMWKNIWK